jgi:hypothetical protein
LYNDNDTNHALNSRLLQRVLLGDTIRDGVEPPQALIPDVVLSGYVHSVHSGAGLGKTFLMLWLALQVIQRGLPVALFDLENGRRMISERLSQLGGDPEKLDDLLHYYPFPEVGLDARSRAEYKALLDETRPALVLMDSWIELLAGAGLDENSSTDVAAWAMAYCKPARERGIAVVLLDHVSHAGGHARGSTRKKDYLDVQWALRNPNPFDRDRVGRITLHRQKDRTGSLPESVGFNVGGGESRFLFERAVTVERPGPADELHPSERLTLEALQEFGVSGATDRQWREAASFGKVSKSSYYRAKNTLLETHRAHRDGEIFTADLPEPEIAP